MSDYPTQAIMPTDADEEMAAAANNVIGREGPWKVVWSAMAEVAVRRMTPNPNPSPEAIMCGGCGETDSEKRCMGCMHDFGTPESTWVQKYSAPPILTKAMIEAGEIECRLQHGAKRVWHAMHAASTPPPTPAETVTVALPGAGEVEAGARNLYLLQGDNARMAEALRQCRDQFAFYAREHYAAGKSEKGDTNTRFADIANKALTAVKPATVAAANDEGVALDWRAVAKLAGEHGVRYRTNTALEKFLAAIRLLSQGGGKS